MYSRSKLRHACYRAKNNAVTEKEEKILKVITPLLDKQHTWDRFSLTWDILLGNDNKIIIVKPEDDYNFITSTCVEVKVLKENGLGLDKLSNRKQNIVKIIENRMLAGIMTWENYSDVWEVTLDRELKYIDTELKNIEPAQLEVTEEMIERSKKEREPNQDKKQFQEIELTTREATEEEKKKIDKLVRKASKKKKSSKKKTVKKKKR